MESASPGSNGATVSIHWAKTNASYLISSNVYNKSNYDAGLRWVQSENPHRSSDDFYYDIPF